MAAYGSQLWDYSSKNCHKFYTAWRKSIRLLLNLDPQTHCHLLHYICSDDPIEVQLHKRFLKFVHTALNSQNIYTSMCAKLATSASNSTIANSFNHVIYKYNLSRYHIAKKLWQSIAAKVVHVTSDVHMATAGAITDFIRFRDSTNATEVDTIIRNLCTQ